LITILLNFKWCPLKIVDSHKGKSVFPMNFRFNFQLFSSLFFGFWIFDFPLYVEHHRFLLMIGQRPKKDETKDFWTGKGSKWNGNWYFEWHTKSAAITGHKLSIDCHLTRALTLEAKIDPKGPARRSSLSTVNWAAKNPFRTLPALRQGQKNRTQSKEIELMLTELR